MAARSLEYIYSIYFSCAREIVARQYTLAKILWGKGFYPANHHR